MTNSASTGYSLTKVLSLTKLRMINEWKLISSFVLMHFCLLLLDHQFRNEGVRSIFKIHKDILTGLDWWSMAASLHRRPPPWNPHPRIQGDFLVASAGEFCITNSGKIQLPWKYSEYSEMARDPSSPHREAPCIPRPMPVQPPQPRHQTCEGRSARRLLAPVIGLRLHERWQARTPQLSPATPRDRRNSNKLLF